MQEAIVEILADYDITQKEDIQEAIDCMHFPEKWDKFIEQWIPSQQHAQFRQKLYQAKVIQTPQQQNTDLFIETYDQIKECQVNIYHIGLIHTKQYKWSNALMDDIQVQMRKSINKILIPKNKFAQFFMNSISSIFDLISRKGNIKEYFDQLKLQLRNIFENQIRNISFSDFVILVIKTIEKKELIGELFNSIGIPIPIAFEIREQVIFNKLLLKACVGIRKHSIILNIGSEKASRGGKTSFMAKLMTLEEKYLDQSHFKNIIHIFTKFNFGQSQNSLFVDFNGIFSADLNPKLKEIIFSLSQYTSLLIIHCHKQELQQKILERQYFQTLYLKVPKILIYIRDVEQTSLKSLKRYIPEIIRQRAHLRILRKFNGTQCTIEHKQQLQYICNNSLNKLQPKFSIVNTLSIDSQKLYKQNQDLIDQAVKQLQNNKKQYVIPNICIIEKLSQIKQKIKEESLSYKNIVKYQSQMKLLKNQLKQPTLTKFIQLFIKIMENGQQSQQNFAIKLYQWKKTKIQPLRSQYLKWTDKLHQKQISYNQLQIKISNNLLQRSNYDISIDKFIHQIIIFNEITKKSQYTKMIGKFYSSNSSEVSPINVIDGKTLQFGNYALEQEIKTISKRYASKKIYVVSVIGAQSSAKSTLLNFLFRCKFETSAGRCTKGAYMSICQMEDMVIIVLDTEGLLSVTERDIAFDHQIATFVLRISNLIIINNKGQLTNTLKQMIQVCAFVLKCLYKDQKKKNFKPQKVVFALRDQTQPKGKFQQQIAAQIKNSLQQMKTSSNVDYRQYFNIQSEDILCFPNAFVSSNGLLSKTGSTKLFNCNFEKCIMGMRKRIADCLKKSQPKPSIYQFYSQASRTWETIRECGQNIMNFRSIHQVITKRNLRKIFEDMCDELTSLIEGNYAQFFSKIKQIESSSQLEKQLYREGLQMIYNTNYQKAVGIYQQKCEQICTNNQWIKQCFKQIEKICKTFKSSNLNLYKKQIQRLKNQQKDLILKNKLNIVIKNLIKQNNSQQQSILKFRDMTSQIRNEIQEKKKNFNQQHSLQLEVKHVFQNLLSLHKGGELKINHIAQCEFFYEEINEKDKIDKLFVKNHGKKFQNNRHISTWTLSKNIFKSKQLYYKYLTIPLHQFPSIPKQGYPSTPFQRE